MEIHLEAEGVEDGEQRGELGIPLATLYGNEGVDTHTGQISQRLLVDAQMLATLLDDCSYLLLIHTNLQITLYCDSGCKDRKKK